ncbi:hypothetical protein D3C80_1068990 [compost metagenome]
MIVFGFPASRLQQRQGLQLFVANETRAVCTRCLEYLAEHFVRHLPAQRFEQLEFLRIRQGAGGQCAVGEKALLADVHVAHHLPVAPFEVPQQGQCLAHPTVLEHRALQVEDETLGRLRCIFGQVRPLQPAIVQGRAVVADRIAGGGELAVVVEAPAA